MKVRILYTVDDTTTEMALEGANVKVQLFKDHRGCVRIYDDQEELVRTVLFAQVHLIDKSR